MRPSHQKVVRLRIQHDLAEKPNDEGLVVLLLLRIVLVDVDRCDLGKVNRDRVLGSCCTTKRQLLI